MFGKLAGARNNVMSVGSRIWNMCANVLGTRAGQQEYYRASANECMSLQLQGFQAIDAGAGIY